MNVKVVLVNLFLIFLQLLLAIANTDVQIPRKTTENLIIDSSVNQWDKISEYTAQMMLNSDDSRQDKLDVTIFFMGKTSMYSVYEGFLQTMLKYGQDRIVIHIFDINKINASIVQMRNMHKDFLIILLDEKALGYQKFINAIFNRIFINKTEKMFVILSYRFTNKNALVVWNALLRSKYYNVYILVKHQSSETFKAYRTTMKKAGNMEIQMYLGKADEHKFLMMKDVLKGDEMSFIRIVFFGTYPISYVNNGSIIGADGNLIQEFSKKKQTTYKVMNEHQANPSINKINKDMETMGDISLYTHADIYSANIQTIRLNQMRGSCLLTPRNIPVLAYGRFNFLMDIPTVIMVLLSTLSVVICWKLITNEMTLTSILIATYEIMLNERASNIEGLTFRENILIYCFILSSFFLVSTFGSSLVSFEFSDSTWRSARNIEELNDSSTKFFSYLDESLVKHNNLPRIRQDLIMNYIKFYNTISLDIPDEFDENLVYVVYCDYANYFMHSSRNYRNGRQLFDKLILTQSYKTYNVMSSYFYIEEFKATVQKFIESGIYDFWKNVDLNKSFGSHRRDQQDKESDFEFKDLVVPLSLLGVGCLIAVIAFLIEYIAYRWFKIQPNQFNNRISTSIRKKKLKLDKWIQKFIIKRKLRAHKASSTEKGLSSDSFIPSKCHNKEHIRVRESIEGGFFIIQKIKRTKKSKSTRARFIQVQPCNPQED